MNGNGNAGDRQHADDRADVDQRLTGQPRHESHRQHAAEALGRAHRGPDAEPHEGAQQDQDECGADETQFLSDDREDEVGLRVGEEPPLGLPAAQPGPDEMAGAQTDEGLHHLVARIRPRARRGR